MDLENELRQAMAERVTGLSASRTLAHDAKRRHQRTVRRRATVAVAAAGIVVAVAMVPTYQAIRPQTVGAPGPEGHRPGGGPRAGADATAQPATPAGPSAAPRAKGEAPHTANPPSLHPGGTHSAVTGLARSLLGYLPSGIRPDGKCDTHESGNRKTTVCRWTGPAGWVEVRLVHDDSLVGPADMGLAPAVSKYTDVNGHTALQGDTPLSQIMWIQHSGLGVWVGVSPGLSGSLAQVADEVHAP